MKELNAESLKKSIAANEAALRLRLKLEPIGGTGNKIFPPTYEGSTYAVEDRLVEGHNVKSYS